MLVWSGGRIPKSLTDAVKRCGGETVDTSPGRKVAPWVEDQAGGLRHLAGQGAIARLVEWLGDDPQKLVGVLGTLEGAYGPGARLTTGDIEPFLGQAGGVPPWS